MIGKTDWINFYIIGMVKVRLINRKAQMIKLEKRDVYIKEFWSMSWFERYIYSVVNQYCSIESRELNPFKLSIHEILLILATLVIYLLIPFVSILEAFHLKNKPMPESKDPMFKGGDNWRIVDQWVVKKCVTST